MFNWLKVNVLPKIQWRNTNTTPNQQPEQTQQELISESDLKINEPSRLEKLQQYNQCANTIAAISYIPKLNEDLWTIIIISQLGGLSAIPFVSKLFNKIWKNININSNPMLLSYFGDNKTFSKLPIHRRLVSGLGMLSLLERSLSLLRAKDYDNLLIVVQRLRRYSAMLFSLEKHNYDTSTLLQRLKFNRPVYYDLSPYNRVVSLYGTDSEAPNESYVTKYAFYGKNGHYIDVECKYNFDQLYARTLKRYCFNIKLKSLTDKKQCQEIIIRSAKEFGYLGGRKETDVSADDLRKIVDWLGGTDDVPVTDSFAYRIIYKSAVYPQRVDVQADHMTLEQVLQYALRAFLNGSPDWKSELSIMSLQAFARLTALNRIKKSMNMKLNITKNINVESMGYNKEVEVPQGGESIASRVAGRKRKIDQISNTEPHKTYQKPTKRRKISTEVDTRQTNPEELRTQEIAELFLNADFKRWESEARVFNREKNEDVSEDGDGDGDDANESSEASLFDMELKEGDILRADNLEFTLYSKDKSKSVDVTMEINEFYNANEMEKQNSFQIQIEASDKSWKYEGSESDSIQDVIKDVDQAVIDTLQLEYINTKQFAEILRAIGDQHENSEVMQKIRATVEE